LFVIP
jgi:hypothetical protein